MIGRVTVFYILEGRERGGELSRGHGKVGQLTALLSPESAARSLIKKGERTGRRRPRSARN